MDGGLAATIVAPAQVKPLINLDGRVVQLPQVVPVAQFKPAVSPTTGATATGCNAARGADSPLTLLLCVPLLAFGLRRRLRRG
jgi:hypothetical protein